MTSDTVAVLIVVGTLIAGFAWGRVSSLLPIPEWLRVATTPIWTGTLAVVVGWLWIVTRFDWTAPRVAEAAKFGSMSVLKIGLGYGVLCFVSGAVLGLPATLGWVVGYRQIRKG
jgi:hypothetical protein